MDWTLAIEHNRAALKRVLAMLVAMAGFAGAGVATPTRQSNNCRPPLKGEVVRRTLPRHLHRAVLRLLRPAESAARRLVIASAREMLVVPVRPMPGGEVGGGLGAFAGVCAPPPLTPTHKGEGDSATLALGAHGCKPGAASVTPSPLWGSEGRARPVARPGRVRGGGAPAVVYHTRRVSTGVRKAKPGNRPGTTENAAVRGRTLPLLDTLPPWNPRRSVRTSFPRISVPGYTQPAPTPPPPAPDDPLDATRLVLRLQALERALDDLPGHARRFARWRHRAGARARYQDAVAARARGHVCRTITQGMKPAARTVRCWPLRMGRPPGSRRRGRHEVHEVLTRTTGLALYALAGRDTS